MSKLSIILNSLAVLVSLVAFALIQSAVSKHQEDLNKIEVLKKKISDAQKDLETQKSELTSKLIRQKNRNQDIAQEILEFKKATKRFWQLSRVLSCKSAKWKKL